MGEVYVYEPNADDLDCMGLCGALTPISCMHTEEANGMSEIEMEHPIDANGRWSFLLDGYILKADVPVRTTPEIRNGALVTTVEKWTVKQTATKGSRYLYTKKSGGKKRKLLPKGLEVRVVAKDTNRHKVKTRKYGTGWLAISAMDYNVTETIPNDPAGIEEVEPAWSVRSQLFRIYDHEVSDTGVTVHAQHIFYDLIGNLTVYDGSTAKVVGNPTAIEAGEGILDGCVVGHDFEFHSNMLDTRGGAKWVRINPVSALLDPEEGLCVQWGAQLVRDDWDIYVLRKAGFNRGVRIEYAKNLLGVQCEVDSSDVVTRVVPMGQTAKGGALLLSGATPWVDSPRVSEYPVPHVFLYDVGSQVKAKSTKAADVSSARNKLRVLAQEKLEEDEIDVPAVSLKVDFLNLGNTAEYAQFAELEALFLFDRVRVRHPDLQIDALCEVHRIEFNCLTGRAEKLELGKVKFLVRAQPIAKWQLPSGINAQSKLLIGSVTDSSIAPGSITDEHMTEGSVGEIHLQDESISPTKLKQRFFEADVIKAQLANIVVANITTANITNANINWASIVTLTAQIAAIAKAQITAANIDSANINWAEIATLTTQIATIARAQITAATIDQANINWAEIAALNANIATIAAAQITAANIDKANVQWADIVTLNAFIASVARAQITEANINQAEIDWSKITRLVSSMATIAKAQLTTATINDALIDWAQIASIQTAVATMTQAAIGSADIGYGAIKDLVTGHAIITEGEAGKLFINRLTVTEANIATLTVGQLLLRTEDGGFCELTVDGEGNVIAKPTNVDGDAIAPDTLSGDRLIEGSVTARELNVGQLFASDAMLNRVKSAHIDVAELFANKASFGRVTANHISADALANLDLRSNVSIRQMTKTDYLTLDEHGVTIGKTDPNAHFKVNIQSDAVNVLQDGEPIAYFQGNKLHAFEGEFKQTLAMGQWQWEIEADGGLSLFHV